MHFIEITIISALILHPNWNRESTFYLEVLLCYLKLLGETKLLPHSEVWVSERSEEGENGWGKKLKAFLKERYLSLYMSAYSAVFLNALWYLLTYDFEDM